MMTVYIIKSSISLLILFGLYWFLLRKEKLFVFNRFFLVLSVVFSLIIPFITIPLNLQNYESSDNLFTSINSSIPVFSQEQDNVNFTEYHSSTNTVSVHSKFYEGMNISVFLLLIYISGAVVLLIRFLRNILFISRQIKSSERITYSGQRLVLTDYQVNPFCFLNTVFVSKQAYLNNEIAGELLNHELEHIRQAHSLDVIFIELIQIIYWFNPIILLYNKAVRVNHEYLADNGAIQYSSDIKIYADKLINFVTCNRNVPLTSGFNPSLTRKRLIMLTKSRSGKLNYVARIFVTINLAFALFLILSFTPSYSQSVEISPGSIRVNEPQAGIVKDIEGNEYRTVKIGSQIWMTENLKTSKFNDGTNIPLITRNAQWQNYEPAFCWFNNDQQANKEKYGALYNWYAVNTKKLCPSGWHIPDTTDLFGRMVNYISKMEGSGPGNKNIAKSLAAVSGWKYDSETGNPGNDQVANNSTGFNGLPAGIRNQKGEFLARGENGIWWTSSEYNEYVSTGWQVAYNYDWIIPSGVSKRAGFSVRCVMDYTPKDSSMTITKGKEANEKYGEKGKNRAIEILTTPTIQAGEATDSIGKINAVNSYPIAVFHKKNNGTISRSMALETDVLEAVSSEPETNLSFEIISFTFFMPTDSIDIIINSDSNKLTDKMRSLLADLKRGQSIVFKDIKAKGPDYLIRDLSPIILKLD